MLENFDFVSQVIISLSLMLIGGYVMSRLTKLIKLPNVTGYILAGIIMGPYCLNVVPQIIIDGMDFISDIALAFIAFTTGEFFTKTIVKSNGPKVVVITIFESLFASVAVFLFSYFGLKLGIIFSIVLGALASATAPASTLMTIRATKAQGDFVDTLLQVVALDDVVGLLAFSVAVAVATSYLSNSFSFNVVILPIIYNIISIVIGFLMGIFLNAFNKRHSTESRLIITIAVIFIECGISSILGVSPLLGCMMMGTVYINGAKDPKLFKQINSFTPPIMLIFFVRSGLNFKFNALFDFNSKINGISLVWIGLGYFLVRILGKYLGAFLGCVMTKKKALVRNNLGLALVPQAGVAIGLAALARRIIGGESGVAIETIILASSVLYELVGPALAKLSLYLSHSYQVKKNKDDKIEEPLKVKEQDQIQGIRN